MTTNFWQTGKIRLRAVEPGDAELFYRLNQEAAWGRNLDFLWPPTSRTAVAAWAEEQSKKRLEDDSYYWVIETLEGKAIGFIETHHCDRRAGTFSHALGIAPEHRRQGYARDALYLVLKYYFEELRYQKVTTPVHDFNAPSIRFHETLGFTLEGRHRRMGYTEGRYFDVLWFGMTIEEYREAFKDYEAASNNV